MSEGNLVLEKERERDRRPCTCWYYMEMTGNMVDKGTGSMRVIAGTFLGASSALLAELTLTYVDWGAWESAISVCGEDEMGMS